MLRNDGSRAATNVRLGHRAVEFEFNIQPEFEHQIRQLPGGGKEIIFPTFPPERLVRITYLYFDITFDQINTHLETDEGPIAVHNVLPVRQYRPWVYTLTLFFTICGVIAVAYVAWPLIPWLWAMLG